MKWCRPMMALGSGIGTLLDEELCDIGMAVPGCLLEQCPLALVLAPSWQETGKQTSQRQRMKDITTTHSK
jgi:hypothetical protein